MVQLLPSFLETGLLGAWRLCCPWEDVASTACRPLLTAVAAILSTQTTAAAMLSTQTTVVEKLSIANHSNSNPVKHKQQKQQSCQTTTAAPILSTQTAVAGIIQNCCQQAEAALLSTQIAI